MIYNLSSQSQLEAFTKRSEVLMYKGEIVELTKKDYSKMSSQQNRYLHLLIGFYAIEFGETLEDTKLKVYKMKANNMLFWKRTKNRKTGKYTVRYRSITDLNSTAFSLSIDRFRNYASMVSGLYLPLPNEKGFNEWASEIDRQKELQKEYL